MQLQIAVSGFGCALDREPGRTNMVVCDLQGNVVDFDIQEGKGDLRSFVLNLDDRWEGEIMRKPVKVFDRRGFTYGIRVPAKGPAVWPIPPTMN